MESGSVFLLNWFFVALTVFFFLIQACFCAVTNLDVSRIRRAASLWVIIFYKFFDFLRVVASRLLTASRSVWFSLVAPRTLRFD